MGSVTLPSLEAQLGVAAPVTAVTDHVEDVLLASAHHALAVIVVRAVDVQVVVDIHLHRVALSTQTEKKTTMKICLLFKTATDI